MARLDLCNAKFRQTLKTRRGSDYIKNYKLLSIIFLITLAVVMAVPGEVVSASTATGVHKLSSTATDVHKLSSTATGVHKSSSTVTAFGWNSCSKGWYKTGGTFENYCPVCHQHGTLTYNPKGTYEGEWTCMHCDSDFCNCGRCKATGSHVYLVKA